jgi:CelD/BcsL family acetyltransferase involved in cellulose biosynthesis
MLSIEKITNREGFAQLASEWDILLQKSAANTVALTHDWLLTWWDIFGEGRELCVLTVRDGAQLVGAAPLLKRRALRFGIPCWRLEFLGSGEDEADEICSDYLDFIAERDREGEVFSALFGFLRDDDWDEIVLKEVRADSPSLAWLQEKLPGDLASEWKSEFTPNGEAVFLPLPATWAQFMEGLSRKLRMRVRQERRMAEQQSCEFVVVSDVAHFEEAFASLVELHQKVWTARGEPGVFASDKFTRFHRALAAKVLPKGVLRLFLIKIEGRAIAALHTFVYDEKVFFYQSGYDADAVIRSPGTVVRNYAIEHCIAEGLREWDFLKAEPGSYKYQWSREVRPLVTVRLAKNHTKEAVLTGAARVVDSLRQAKRALKR